MPENELSQGKIDHFRLLATTKGEAIILTARTYYMDEAGMKATEGYTIYSPGTIDPKNTEGILGPIDEKRAEARKLAEEHGVNFIDPTETNPSEV